MQYLTPEYSIHLLHPSHLSMIGWQLPPLKLHPFLVIKTHSEPFLTVWQSMGIIPLFLIEYISDKKSGRHAAGVPIVADVPNKLERFLPDKTYRVNKNYPPGLSSWQLTERVKRVTCILS